MALPPGQLPQPIIATAVLDHYKSLEPTLTGASLILSSTVPVQARSRRARAHAELEPRYRRMRPAKITSPSHHRHGSEERNLAPGLHVET